MKYAAVIFDLDGTLLDTLKDLTDATNYALASHGLPLHSADEVRSFIGDGISKLIARAVPEGTPQTIQKNVLDAFNLYYKEHCADNTRPYPGILPLLADLRKQGCQTAIVSNKADYAVQELAEQYFPGLLDAACGERPGIACKPAPDMLLTVMAQLRASKENTIYVGDSDTDLLTALNADIPCIGACWGFRGRSFLLEHGATLLADRAENIIKLCE